MNEAKLFKLLGAICERLDRLIALFELEPHTPHNGPTPPPGAQPVYGVKVLPKRDDQRDPAYTVQPVYGVKMEKKP